MNKKTNRLNNMIAITALIVNILNIIGFITGIVTNIAEDVVDMGTI